ncbi:diphosphate--fructose-6-phosphate 1-phosphotransferase [Virgibacillus siamensis]|uniref:diphosphate--fructose-6-phosphate 1-phosphotransferase n=1 Tax=Virgibacillus siamensis TaxID=480071 RepID=UPI0009861C9B|nr:diphosphate--fructose-6-phosphate 1-phosphotransferase [Virgibacillus siamensis]
MKRIAIGMAGGPTTVINATLAAFVRALYKEHSLTFIMNGYEGLANKKFLQANDEVIDIILAHEKVPGASLGSGRYTLNQQQIIDSVHILRDSRIDALVFIGGNGTMEALEKIKEEAHRQHYQLQLLGIPKTVDNDLSGTDHSPGFGSSARYVAQATRDMGRDLLSMNNFEQVRIIETMGRNVGWLAAAAGFFKKYDNDPPHFIAIPEKPLNREHLFHHIDKAIKDYGVAFIVAGEGVYWGKGVQIEKGRVNGRSILGGISKEIEHEVKEHFNVVVRSELLGMNQRSCSVSVSDTDYKEAVQVGYTAARWLKEGASEVMVSIYRAADSLYEAVCKPVSLKSVIQQGERKLPEQYWDDQAAYNEWLRPLIGYDLVSYPPSVLGEKQ